MKRLILTSLLVMLMAACNANEFSGSSQAKNMRTGGNDRALASNDSISKTGSLSEETGEKGSIDETKGAKNDDPKGGNPTPAPTLPPPAPVTPPVIVPCKYNDTSKPDYVILKDAVSPGLPAIDVPKAIVQGALQPDGKTYIGSFVLYSDTISWWTAKPSSRFAGQVLKYALVITNMDVETCAVSIRLVSQTGRVNGCFAATTLIRMANGSDLMAALLTVGDQVYNPATRSASRVVEVVSGPEANKSMYEVRAGGRVLQITERHPLLTRSGIKKAQELSLADAMMDETGQYVPVSAITVLPVNASQQVVNLRLESASNFEDEHLVLANGLVSGDLYLQRILESN